MDKLLECTKEFENLLHTKYHIVLGRKGQLVNLEIVFTKWEFHHLMGLGKLKDLRIARGNRVNIFEQILEKNITYETISKSRYINEIEARFEPLAHIEEILDNNNLVFRYNAKLNTYSMIQADFLLSSPYDGNDIYIFVSRNEDETYFCRSFFPKSEKDYTLKQTKYTMLYKEKINMFTGEKIIQYNKLP